MRPSQLTPPPLLESLGMLERAVGYTRIALVGVTPAALGNRTPCERWDLAALLDHMADSLDAITEAADLGHVQLDIQAGPASPVGRVELLRERACQLIGAMSLRVDDEAVLVGDRPLSLSLLACAGALEVVVHGWDVSQATGARTPLPTRLALDLLPWVPVLVTEHERPQQFAPELDVPMGGPSSRLLAVLGRDGG